MSPRLEVYIDDVVVICDHSPFDSHEIPQANQPFDQASIDQCNQNIERIQEIAHHLQAHIDPLQLFMFMAYTYVYWPTWRPALLSLSNENVLRLATNLIPFIQENWEELVIPYY